jgi:hypothetical protein
MVPHRRAAAPGSRGGPRQDQLAPQWGAPASPESPGACDPHEPWRKGRRPVYGGARKFQEDPHWRDHLLFYEYFHGDNGAGLGASHQTGWTGIIARSLHLFATSTAEQFVKLGKVAGITEAEPAPSGRAAGTARSDSIRGRRSRDG